MHHVRTARLGFTLIELLTVIAIIGILAAILIPTVGKVRETARRTVDASNLRQIGQAALIYANDNDGRLPGTGQTALDANGLVTSTGGSSTTAVTINVFAAALAQGGGLNDAGLWVSASDSATANNAALSTVLSGTTTKTIAPSFNTATLSFLAVSGLTTSRPSTTPIAFTRGLQTNGSWTTAGTTAAGSVYGTDGGHIVFLGGNVQFYKQLTGGNQLISVNGSQTSNILQTLPSNIGITALSGAPLSAAAGTGAP